MGRGVEEGLARGAGSAASPLFGITLDSRWQDSGWWSGGWMRGLTDCEEM